MRVNQTFNFSKGFVTVFPVHPVISPEYRMGLMTGIDMITLSLTPAFLKFVTEQCLKSWNLKFTTPAFRHALLKAVFTLNIRSPL